MRRPAKRFGSPSGSGKAGFGRSAFGKPRRKAGAEAPDVDGATPEEGLPGGAGRAADPEAARMKGIALLARRDYGSAELAERLLATPFTPVAVEAAIAALQASRYLDDGRYAEHFVAYHAGRGQGPRRVRLGLRGKGLPADLIAQAVDENSTTWATRAQDLRRRRFGVEAPSSLEERARQSRFLLYRGFTPAQVRHAFTADQVDLDDLDLDGAVPEDPAHDE